MPPEASPAPSSPPRLQPTRDPLGRWVILAGALAATSHPIARRAIEDAMATLWSRLSPEQREQAYRQAYGGAR